MKLKEGWEECRGKDVMKFKERMGRMYREGCNEV